MRGQRWVKAGIMTEERVGVKACSLYDVSSSFCPFPLIIVSLKCFYSVILFHNI